MNAIDRLRWLNAGLDGAGAALIEGALIREWAEAFDQVEQGGAWRPATGQDWTAKQIAREANRSREWVAEYARAGEIGGCIPPRGAGALSPLGPYWNGNKVMFRPAAVADFLERVRTGRVAIPAAQHDEAPAVALHSTPVTPIGTAMRRPRSMRAEGRLEERLSAQPRSSRRSG